MSKNKTADILERLERVEAAIAKIGHNGGPPLDIEELPKAKPPLRNDLPVAPRYLTESQAAARYCVNPRTLRRWDENPEIGFPPPVLVRKRRFREVAGLEAWERQQAAQATAQRHLKATTKGVTGVG